MNDTISPLTNGDFEVEKETVYHVTRKDFVQAFQKWNKAYLEQPEEFMDDSEISEYSPELQAESFIEFLNDAK